MAACARSGDMRFGIFNVISELSSSGSCFLQCGELSPWDMFSGIISRSWRRRRSINCSWVWYVCKTCINAPSILKKKKKHRFKKRVLSRERSGLLPWGLSWWQLQGWGLSCSPCAVCFPQLGSALSAAWDRRQMNGYMREAVRFPESNPTLSFC